MHTCMSHCVYVSLIIDSSSMYNVVQPPRDVAARANDITRACNDAIMMLSLATQIEIAHTYAPVISKSGSSLYALMKPTQ